LKSNLLASGLEWSGECRGWQAWAGKVETGPASGALVDAGELALGIMPSVVRLAAMIKVSLAELTPDQLDQLNANGIDLCGEGGEVKGLGEMLSERIGIEIRSHSPEIHPAITGLHKLLPVLDKVGTSLRKR
ncbi:MAG: rod shape-determining protein, partial [Planctomycetes bacterium]|nr:rod shape-determining protein [Planctomycetota bacterium]